VRLDRRLIAAERGRIGRRLAGLLVAATIAVSMAGVPRAYADAAGDEAGFLAKLNNLRASKGLNTLATDGQLHSIALNWSRSMAAQHTLSHNPNLGTEVTENWTKLGENVGFGPDVDTVAQAFVNSPHHYANLVDPAWGFVGIGVTYTSDGALWVTEDFMQLAGNPPPPPPPQPAPTNPPATNPPSTSPPATNPPATNPPATSAPATAPPGTAPAGGPPATAPAGSPGGPNPTGPTTPVTRQPRPAPTAPTTTTTTTTLPAPTPAANDLADKLSRVDAFA
jgi:hypothetical protein